MRAGAPEWTGRTVGRPRPAQATPERYQIDVRRQKATGRNQIAEDRMAPAGIRFRRHPAEPPRHSMDVRVDRKDLAAAREQEDAGRGLLSHALEAHQVAAGFRSRHPPQDVEAQPTLVGYDAAQRSLDHGALGEREASDPDRLLQIATPGRQDLLPGRESVPQRGVGPIAVGVARALGQDGEDQLVERRQLAAKAGPTEGRLQTIERRRDAAAQRGKSRPSHAHGANLCANRATTLTGARSGATVVPLIGTSVAPILADRAGAILSPP